MVSTDTTGRRGVHIVGIALEELGWKFREQTTSDFGIDAQAEAPNGSGRPNGRLIAIQIKAGASWFNETTPKGVVYRGSLTHLGYWREYTLPVIVVLCDLDRKICLWQAVTSETVEPTAKGWKLVVPSHQFLNDHSAQQLLQVAASGRTWLAMDAGGRDEEAHGGVWVGQLSVVRDRLRFSEEYCRVTLAKVGRKYRSELYVARPADAEIQDFLMESTHPTARCLIMKERAGSGKTNLVCNLANRLIEEGYPCVFVLGSQPIEDRYDLVRECVRALGIEPQGGMPAAQRELKEVLENLSPRPLCVLVDAINEAREVDDMREALAELLAQLKPLRARILITCRDIYWTFLDGEWARIMETEARSFELYRYDAETWPTVLKRYFSSYRVTGELTADAERTCLHPLLLRFFCEAYEGEDVGVVKQIRLKRLFEKYLDKKVERLARASGGLFRVTESVTDCLQSIAAGMLDSKTMSLPEQKVTALTGDSGRLRHDSLYVRLLDEDIILDEIPDTRSNRLFRQVRFVYEAFFEFLLARELESRWRDLTNEDVIEEVVVLLEPSTGMRNVQGAVEYLDEFFEERSLSLWKEVARRKPAWQGLVLASLREADPLHLPERFRDAFPILMNSLNYETRQAAANLLQNAELRERLDPECIQLIAHLRTDRRREVRYAAIRALPELQSLKSEQMLEVLRASLDPSTPVRKEVLNKIPSLDELTKARFLPILLEASRARQGTIRSYAILALDLKVWSAARAGLLESLSDSYSWARRAALIRLTDYPRKRDVATVAQCLSDSHSAVRRLAAILAGRWNFREFGPLLEQQIRSEKNAEVLRQLAQSLVKIKAKETIDVLRQLLSHRDYKVRTYSGEILYEALGSKAIPSFREALERRPRGHWIASWPQIENFGGARGIARLTRKGFQNRKFDLRTSALLSGVFLTNALEEDAGLLECLKTNMAKLDPEAIESFVVGLRARGGSEDTVNNEELRPMLTKLLFEGTHVTRVNIAYLFGRFAQQVSSEEKERLLHHASPEERDAFVWGIHYSQTVSNGWHLRWTEADKDEEDENESEVPNRRVPSWRYFIERGFQLGPSHKLIDDKETTDAITDEDIPF
jgi:HEAT repeat protein